MRLSEAIRLGAMLRPQIYSGAAFSARGSCAWGAAWEAVGLRDFIMNCQGSIDKKFDELRWREISEATHICPVCQHTEGRQVCVIAHLNDVHRWTRERIADWVEGIERDLEATDAVSINHICDATKMVTADALIHQPLAD